MALKIKQNGEVKDLIIPACGVQILDMEDNFESSNLEEVLQEIGEGESIYVSDKEPDKDGIWISSDNTTTAGENQTLLALKAYLNEKLGTAELTTDDKTIKGAINKHEKQIKENSAQLSESVQQIDTIKTDYAKKVDVNILASSKAEKTTVNTLENKVNLIGTLKFQGNIADLSELTSVKANGIYLNTTDGYTYSWDGAMSVKLNLFQNNGVAENSINIGKLTTEFKNFGDYTSVVEASSVIQGWYNVTTKTQYELSNANLSYYNVSEGEMYKYSAYAWEKDSGAVIFFDSNGNMISYIGKGTGSEKLYEGTLVIPYGCVKVALWGRYKTPKLTKFIIYNLANIKNISEKNDSILSSNLKYYDLEPLYKDGYYNKNTAQLSTSPSYNMQYDSIPVVAGEKYKVTCLINESVTAGVLLVDSSNKILATYMSGTGSNIQYTDYEIEIQSGVTNMLVTTRVDIGKHSVKKLSLLPLDTKEATETGDINDIYLKIGDNTEREFSFKYSEDKDMIVRCVGNGVNGIFSISNFYLIDNTNKYCSGTFPDFSTRTQLKGVYSDIIGPVKASAVNNIDGNEATVGNFVGGWHGTLTNNKPSARCVLGKIYIDEQEATSKGIYKGKEIRIEYINYLQGYNTTKSTGDGREILTEKVTLRITKGKIDVVNTLTALEDTKLGTYFGIQTENGGAWNDEVRFLTDAKTIVKTFDSDYDCMEKCNYFICKKDNHYITSYIKPIGLGNRKYNSEGKKQAHSRNYGGGSKKVYFDLISDDTTVSLTAGECVNWQGGYILSYNNYRLD